MTDSRLLLSRRDRDAISGTSLRLDPGVASGLAYLLGGFGGALILLVERQNREVRFHAAQSVLLTGALIGLWLVLAMVSAVPMFSLLAQAAGVFAWMTGIAGWIYLIVSAYRLQPVRVVGFGGLADRMAAIERH